jgi:hypothetical protein
MKRFFLSLSPCLLVPLSLLTIGCTQPQDKSQSQLQQLQQQLKADEATLQQLQQQEQADQALIKQIQQELSELRKRRNEPCPHCPHQNVDQLADPAFSDASQKRQSLEDNSTVGSKMSPDGSEEIQLDLPGQEHMKNKGGVDSAGLCLFTSIEIAAHWMNVRTCRKGSWTR